MSEIWQLTVTATHLLENLATDLYGDPGDCLHELVRNGMVACMPDGKWVPKKGFVEIFLVDNHPLAPKCKSLVILDHGSGFTEPCIKLYCTIGRAIGDQGNEYSGAAQKRIGRFSAFAQNKKCLEDRDITTGFYILTRTASEGPVTMVSMIPEKIERQGGAIVPRELHESANELGPQKGIRGSFTAIIIPNSVFETYDQIRQALMWRVPRKKDLMYRLEIGGKPTTAPPLADKVTILQQEGDVKIETYIDKLKDKEDPEGGIWFTDMETGLRVASARALGSKLVPYPLWRPDMTGDIFVPGILANQSTSRSGFSHRYLQSKSWKKVTAYLVGQVVPKVKALLGDDDVFGRDSTSRSILSFVERANQIWGKAEDVKGGATFEDVFKRNGGHSGKPSAKPTGTRGAQLNPGPRPGARAIPIRIGNRTFVLNKRLMDPRLFAEVDRQNGQVIHINDHEYMGMPKTREARDEHVILKILEAAATAQTEDIQEVQFFVAERRHEMMGKK